MNLNPKDYHFDLPPELIANHPIYPRDYCRLMHLDRQSQKINHSYFYNLVDLLTSNDILVLNQSQVFPARIFGQKTTGGQVEVLLCQQISDDSWITLTKPGLKEGTSLEFTQNLSASVLKKEIDEKIEQIRQRELEAFKIEKPLLRRVK